MIALSQDQRSRLANWLAKAPRTERDFLRYRSRVGISEPLFKVAEALSGSGIAVEIGAGYFSGRRLFYWVDSGKKSLRLRLAEFKIAELNFDDSSIGRRRRRKVKRGKIK